MDEDQKTPGQPWVVGAVAAALLGALAYYVWPQPAPAPVTAATIATPAPDAPEPAPEPAAAPDAPPPPRFDTVRLDADGDMVVAGRAAPGQIIDLILSGEVIASTVADASGGFVFLGDIGPSEQPRRLSLLADPDSAALPSQGSYLVAPILPLAAIPPVADIVPPAPAAPVVVQADAQGLRLVQGAPDLPAPNVGLDAITYDPQGNVQIAGRATGAGQVQIYLDDDPVASAPVQAGGDWRLDLADIATGTYVLRIDELDTSGAVVSRLETPFRREEPANVAAVMAEDTAQDGFEVAVRTVQPGSTLWAIAEETLGNGIFYVQVFEANSDLIRDPDLIYPGQIFRIPDKLP